MMDQPESESSGPDTRSMPNNTIALNKLRPDTTMAESAPEQEWAPSKHEKAIIYTLAFLNLLVSLDATIIVTSLTVTISVPKVHYAVLTFYQDECDRYWRYHNRSLLDWHVLSPRKRRHHANDLLHERCYWSSHLPHIFYRCLFRWYDPVLRRRQYGRNARRAVHSGGRRRWYPLAELGYPDRLCPPTMAT